MMKTPIKSVPCCFLAKQFGGQVIPLFVEPKRHSIYIDYLIFLRSLSPGSALHALKEPKLDIPNNPQNHRINTSCPTTRAIKQGRQNCEMHSAPESPVDLLVFSFSVLQVMAPGHRCPLGN